MNTQSFTTWIRHPGSIVLIIAVVLMFVIMTEQSRQSEEDVHSRHFLHVGCVVIAEFLKQTPVFVSAAEVDDHRTCHTEDDEQPVRVEEHRRDEDRIDSARVLWMSDDGVDSGLDQSGCADE